MSPIHDYTISNASGSSVRNDLQDALRALNSANSNGSAPTSQLTAFTPWGDTGNNIFKRRNQANNDWVSLRKADGTVLIPDGSASSPSIQPTDDGNTGIYSPASDQIGISCGGTLRLTISGTGITTTEPIGLPDANASLPALVFSDDTDTGIYSSTANQLDISTGGSRRLSVNSNDLSVVPNLVLENQADLRLSEASGNGTNYIALQAPASISSNFTLTLPSTDGSSGQVLKTDGSGNLSFGTVSTTIGSTSIPTGGSATTITGLTTVTSTNVNSTTTQATTIKTNATDRVAPVFQNSSGTEIAVVCKAYANFNGQGSGSTRTIRDDFNVSSVDDLAVGFYQVNFANNMADADYSAIVTGDVRSPNNRLTGTDCNDYTTSSFRISSADVSSQFGNGRADTKVVTIAVFGNT